MMLAIVYILLKSVSRTSILFMVPIFLAPLATSSHPILQGISHLVSFFGTVECCLDVVIIPVSSMSPAVVTWVF